MKLGDSVFFIDKDGCMAIRKATITCVKHTHGFRDFLSSRPNEEYRGVEYIVCAVKNGDYHYFETKFVFDSLEAIREYFADVEFEKYDLLK